MEEPRATRPFMPGYGVQAADEGGGLLPWSWAVERLIGSHDYWVATVWPPADDARPPRPHVMPVWGVWHEDAVWFSSSRGSRKARNLQANPTCVITTDNALEPVVLEGTADVITDRQPLAAFVDRINAKYASELTVDFVDPAVNSTFRVHPSWVFALTEENFTGSPTRWDLGRAR
jgi:hypothetical protein